MVLCIHLLTCSNNNIRSLRITSPSLSALVDTNVGQREIGKYQRPLVIFQISVHHWTVVGVTITANGWDFIIARVPDGGQEIVTIAPILFAPGFTTVQMESASWD